MTTVRCPNITQEWNRPIAERLPVGSVVVILIFVLVACMCAGCNPNQGYYDHQRYEAAPQHVHHEYAPSAPIIEQDGEVERLTAKLQATQSSFDQASELAKRATQEAEQAKQRAAAVEREARYTGAILYTDLEHHSCAACNRLVSALMDYGWSVGESPDCHFWLKQAPFDVQQLPHIVYMRNGQVYHTETGYSGADYKCPEANAIIDWHPASKTLRATQARERSRRDCSASRGRLMSAPVYVESAPVYYSAPSYSFGVGVGGGWNCSNGTCVRVW